MYGGVYIAKTLLFMAIWYIQGIIYVHQRDWELYAENIYMYMCPIPWSSYMGLPSYIYTVSSWVTTYIPSTSAIIPIISRLSGLSKKVIPFLSVCFWLLSTCAVVRLTGGVSSSLSSTTDNDIRPSDDTHPIGSLLFLSTASVTHCHVATPPQQNETSISAAFSGRDLHKLTDWR